MTQHIETPTTLPAEISLGGGQCIVTIDGVRQPANARTVASALSWLCGHAVTAHQHYSVRIREGMGQRYMSIDPTGNAVPAAPPAPDRVPVVRSSDLGVGDSDVQREWIQDELLSGGSRESVPPKAGWWRGWLSAR